jgi:predicted metal-dependent hydrolase
MDYQLIRSKRKTLSLQINKQAQLLVRAPMRLKIQTIEAFILEKQHWVKHKQQLAKDTHTLQKEYQNRACFLLLGQEYPLQRTIKKTPLVFKKQVFYLGENLIIRDEMLKFYKKEFIKIATQRLEFYAQKHNLKFNQVRFKTQKTRWGSCSAQNNINLNYLLMMAPMVVINAVIAHELAHIEHKNHSKKFYKLLFQIFPDYQQADNWLKENTYKLHNL